jgi:hypothetical protein
MCFSAQIRSIDVALAVRESLLGLCESFFELYEMLVQVGEHLTQLSITLISSFLASFPRAPLLRSAIRFASFNCNANRSCVTFLSALIGAIGSEDCSIASLNIFASFVYLSLSWSLLSTCWTTVSSMSCICETCSSSSGSRVWPSSRILVLHGIPGIRPSPIALSNVLLPVPLRPTRT